MGYRQAPSGRYAGVTLDGTQLGYCLTAANSAATYIDGTADDYHAAVIGVMTMMQESGIRNLGWGDRDSVGLFQQRPSCGWGTIAECQDPVHASRMFFQALNRVRGWQGKPYTLAAQAVQVSAYPLAYGKWQPMAEAVLAAMHAPDVPNRPISLHAAAQLCAKAIHGGHEFVKVEHPSKVALFLNDALRRAGYKAPALHIVTPQTVAAVEAFQRHHHLAPFDGVPGPVMLHELCAIPANQAHGYSVAG